MRRLAFACLLTMVAVPAAHAGTETFERAVIIRHVATLFMKQRFAELNRLESEYRTGRPRTRSGLWKLTMYYGGIIALANGNISDQAYWRELENKARLWIKEYPRSPAAYISYSLILEQHGWQYRGSGWADQVKPQEWEPFYRYVRRARMNLMEHKQIADPDPQWYDSMVMLARDEGWDKAEFKDLMDEATSKYPYYSQLYFDAVNYLEPRWYGDREQIEGLANFAVEKTKAMEGMEMYARIYWFDSEADSGDRLFVDTLADWTKMRQGFDVIVARYPSQWNINNFAHFACLAGDEDETRRLLRRIEGPPILAAWDGGGDLGLCEEWVHSSGWPPVVPEAPDPTAVHTRT